ncbi:transglycosylase domain-containing protein [Propionicimonas sp.]|uniref:transglycosylase domain-containing protein n=1 Tax=Propionicimonas sp. TaxID=1955623 RepID=UPI0017FEC813|nr:transglycosylase domain-containing protein [Propionicimonas sp.]MBU3975839.1 penicillin-binding protein [Actinomycetota bacterium]MBA3022173.1 penicillin-binding protein [Propionicimonas sp.]MBU3987389.1 penicillin-binding protein [Actinomycetota bacterium]MBU4006392.1 penicillin-binding protein [Actinomycetota bacterium]MBU4065271.1 penicillin-binding protein [Actinomycetota bacterium]
MGKPKRVSAANEAGLPTVGGTTGKRKPPRALWQRILLWGMVTVLSLGLIGAGVVAYAYQTIKLPDANADFKTNTTFVYYDDGKTPIGSFQVQNRVTIDYNTMPQYTKDAMVAAENRTFWTDPGISVTGLFRAALGLVGISSASATETGGGSTLTQQYIKIMYLTQEKTFSRKFTEILLAAKVGQEISKEDILRDYLNTVYFGRGAYGLEAGAQAYFKKPASKLTLAESVALCAIVNSPGNLDPTAGEKQAADLLQRYQYTLNGMVEMGKITEAQRSEVYNQLPKFLEQDTNSRLGGQRGFLLKLVQNEMLAKGFTDEQISGGGYKVVTTFNKKAQDAAVSVAKAKTLQASGGNKKKAATLKVAIASLDNATGGVIAMYGNPDYVKNSRNWATTPRETGSTFKPYALAAALRDGWTLNDKVSRQTKVSSGGNMLPWPDGKKVTLLQATTQSINDAYYNLVSQIPSGPEGVIQAANDAGLPTGAGWAPDAYLPLGGPNVSPVDQASGFSTFANMGIHHEWHVINQVFDSANKVTYAADTTGLQTIETGIAQDVTAALTNVVRDGTGRAAAYIGGYQVAGKTGSKGQDDPNFPRHSGHRQTVATWFVGYTKQISTAVMYVRGEGGHEDLGYGWFGSGAAAQTWAAYMRIAMEGKPYERFPGATNKKSTQTPTPEPEPTPTWIPTPTPTVPYTPAPTDTPTESTPPTAPTTGPPTTPAATPT